MRISHMVWAGAAAALSLGQTGLAQTRVMQFDLNNLAFQSLNALGAPSAFGGLTHTGSLNLFDTLPSTELVSILISTGGGPFQTQAGSPWNLTDVILNINLAAGNVTGGSLLIDINGGPGVGGDRYSATVGASGSVSTFVGGGFKVEGLSMAGGFSDAAFGPINVADFFAASPALVGSFLSFRIQPNANGSGFADTDAFVSNIPAPGSLACLAAAGLLARRRRR